MFCGSIFYPQMPSLVLRGTLDFDHQLCSSKQLSGETSLQKLQVLVHSFSCDYLKALRSVWGKLIYLTLFIHVPIFGVFC